MYLNELPPCPARFGRIEIIEIIEKDKKVVKTIITCGYREIDPEECIICGGFPKVKIKIG
jgi:hypothetical protein